MFREHTIFNIVHGFLFCNGFLCVYIIQLFSEFSELSVTLARAPFSLEITPLSAPAKATRMCHSAMCYSLFRVRQRDEIMNSPSKIGANPAPRPVSGENSSPTFLTINIRRKCRDSSALASRWSRLFHPQRLVSPVQSRFTPIQRSIISTRSSHRGCFLSDLEEKSLFQFSRTAVISTFPSFFVRSGRTVVIPMRRNSRDLDIFFVDRSGLVSSCSFLFDI